MDQAKEAEAPSDEEDEAFVTEFLVKKGQGSLNWQPFECSYSELVSNSLDIDLVLSNLCQGKIPAIIIREALDPEVCATLVQRLNFLDDDQIKFVNGESRESCERFDVGTSLGVLGHDPEAFFRDAEKTRDLFEKKLLARLPQNPLDVLYAALSNLAKPLGCRVMTAVEPNDANKTYGPAIFRSHKPHRGYPPHFDSVRWREKRMEYPAVYSHETQLAGILLIQAPELRRVSSSWQKEGSVYSDCIIYKQPAMDLVDVIPKHSDNLTHWVFDPDAFSEYVETHSVPSYPVNLNTGDLYFFKCDSMHAVPGFDGKLNRVTLATFIGVGPDKDDRISVWS
jgi:hypothetical protein